MSENNGHNFQGSTNNQPVYNYRPVRKRKPPFIAIVVIILAIGAVAVFAKDAIILAVKPELYLSNAVSSTIGRVSQEYKKSKSSIFNFGDTKDNAVTSGMSVKFVGASSSKDYVARSLGYLKGFEVSQNSMYDPKGKQLAADLKCLYKGNSLVSGKLFWTDNEIGLSIPELFDEWVTVPSKDFGKRWAGSSLEYLTRAEFNNSIDLSISKMQELFKDAPMDLEALRKYDSLFRTLTANMRVVRNGKGYVTLEDGMKECTRLMVQLSTNSVKNALTEYIDIIINDKRIKERSEVLGMNPEFEINQLYSELNTLKRNIRDYVNFSDDAIIMYMYINGGNVVMAETIFDMEVDGEYANFLITAGLKGRDNLIDNVSLETEIEADGEKLTLLLESKGNHVPKGGLFNDNTLVELKVPYEDKITLEAQSRVDFNKRSDNMNFSAIFKGADEFDMKLDGKGYYNSSNSGMELNFDEFNFDYKDNWEDFKLQLAGNMFAKKGANIQIGADSGNRLNLLDMSENQLYDFSEDIEERSENLSEVFEDILGY